MRDAPILLTPGPLTTTARTRQAMLMDWGSWDADFNTTTASVCEQLLGIVQASASHCCVPLQGSGTFAVEAAIATLVPRDGKVLVLINGAYGERLAKICQVLGRRFTPVRSDEVRPTCAAEVDRLLADDPTLFRSRRTWQRPDHRRHELVRRTTHRCPSGPLRGADRRLGQMPGGGAGNGLRPREWASSSPRNTH